MAPLLEVCDLSVQERPVRFRKPFRFGAVTVESTAQAFITAEIDIAGHGRSRGMSAELMVPKWFDKNPALSTEQTVDELRRSLQIAINLYLKRRGQRDTAFGHSASHYRDHVAACAAEGIPALAAAFGPAEVDKAIFDALLRALKIDAWAGFAGNAMGLDARLAPDLDTDAINRFLGSRRPQTQIAIRHTIGMADALEGKGGLAEIHAATGCRYFKIKLCGDAEADRKRLAEIIRVLATRDIDYRATLDANEQYADLSSLTALCDALAHDPALAALKARLLYLEQPMPRETTREVALGELAARWPFIIDEADDAYDALPAALKLGYRGVSTKSCKGFYKSLLNGTRAVKAGNAFIAAEDLTCQAGLALQQDSALVAFLGIDHAERNGHHYVEGFAGAPKGEAEAFLAAHPDLYEAREGRIGLRITDGVLRLGSLAQPGFASAVLPTLAAGMAAA